MQNEDRIITLLESIDKKFSLLIGEDIKRKFPSIREQVDALNKSNFDYKEIAFMLGISQTHAAKEISVLKKKVVTNG